MQNATLSPWTISCFTAACLFLIAGQVMMLTGYGYPADAISAPRTLALVHVIVIGWLGLLMTGALLQFVPVLTARPLRCGALALPALLLIVIGVITLACGFAALAGASFLVTELLPAGAVMLAAGFSLVVIMIGVTLYSARPLPLPARFVAVGIASLIVTVSLGGSFAFTLSGIVERTAFSDLLGGGVGLHAALGLGGWMSFTALGVSYRLFAMFMLAPEQERTGTRIVWWSGAIALALVVTCVLLLLVAPQWIDIALCLAGLLTVLAVTLYGRDVLEMYRKRRRKALELNSRASLAALAMSALAVLALAEQAFRGFTAPGPAIYLAVFGWLTGLGLAQLYKIVPFMTWLEFYGPLLGKGPVPRVQDLVNERRGAILFRVWYASVLLATGALYLQNTIGFRVATLAQLLATAALLREFAGARRLSFVKQTTEPAASLRRPHLFLPPLQQKR